jgi:mxaJ protein
MPRSFPRAGLRRHGAAIAAVILAWLALVSHGPGEARAALPPLRVCADPNNFPFSDRAERGFENQLAALVAKELDRPLQYLWWAQRRGFFRNTLSAGMCDLVISVPSGLQRVRTTAPYYHSRYAFVTRKQRHIRVRRFDDAALRGMRIGVQLVGDDYANTPPAHALARHHLVDNVVGFTLYGDYSEPSPPSAILEAVRDGAIDIAVVWGPLTASDPERQRASASRDLNVVPVAVRQDAGLPLEFAISMGVRKDDIVLQRQLDRVITRRRDAIEAILTRFEVPHTAVERSKP